MSSTPAKIAGKAGFHLFQGRVWGRLKQPRGGHDHAVGAIATLGCLFGDEGGLDRGRFFRRAEALDGDHGAACRAFYRSATRERRFAIDQNGAGAALSQPAAELRTLQIEVGSPGTELEFAL